MRRARPLRRPCPPSLLPLLLGLLLSVPLIAAGPAAARDRYPPRWFQPVAAAEKASWEILPQEAGPGEVILSKRNDLGLLSNFAEAPFTLDGVRYASVEGFWQAMYYPEGAGDPRAAARWPRTRAEVAALSGFAAKGAGNEAKELLKGLGIDWISYRGQRLQHRGKDQGAHRAIILRALQAKAAQNPPVRELLLCTGDLKLRPDHTQPPDRTPAYAYHEMWMEIRAALQDEERRAAERALSRWSREARARIVEATWAALCQRDRVAVFDADGTLWHADAPREFLQHQIERRHLPHFDYSEPAPQATQRLYDTCQSEVTICIAQAAYLHAGLSLAELDRHMAEFFAGFDGKVFPAQRELVRYLGQRGFLVYVVSGGPHFLNAYAARRYFDVPPERVLGVRTRVAGGVLTGEVIPPVPFREGKMRAMERLIGKEILFAAGNTGSDVPMLEQAQLLPIAVHSFGPETPGFHHKAEQELLKEAGRRGWLIQGF